MSDTNHKMNIDLQYKLRNKILDLYYKVNAGHIGCSLSCIDILISIFFYNKSEKDSFILSKGHAANALYVCLNEMGEISDEVLNTYYTNGTTLPAHPAPNKFKNIPFATGSLGHGFPLATGMAKGKKLKNNKDFVFCLMSDGETNEGTTWEAAHFAIAHKLDNLIVFIDKNKIQGFGKMVDILGDTADVNKWISMGFECVEVDGHNVEALNTQIEIFKKSSNSKPKLIIANTVKGRGVSYMEDTVDWHYLPMSEVQYQNALEEINSKYGA